MVLRIGIDCHFESKIKQGTNTYVSELVNALSRIDLLNKYYLLNADYQNSYYQNNFKKVKIKTNSTRTNIIYGFRRIAIDNQLDIIHTNYLSPFWIPCKSIVTIHDILYLTHKKHFPFIHALQLGLLTPLTIKFANRILTVSEYTKSQIIGEFGVEENKIGVTPEAASSEFKRLGDQTEIKAEIKEKYNIENNYILYVGRLAPIKNLPRMLSAWTEYNSTYINEKISFVLVGDYDPVYPDKQIRKAISQVPDDFQVCILKGVPANDLVKLYNAAECFLIVSLGEGFGLPILEAMSCGTPVITSDITACPEVAGHAAIQVDPYNVKAIFDGLCNALSSEGLRAKLINEGLKRASLFSWDKCAQATLKNYRICYNDEDTTKYGSRAHVD